MVKVFLICSGLGNVNRGFESFTQECFDALSQVPELDINLFKGGGESKKRQIVLWNFPRDSWLATYLGTLTSRGAYYIEQPSLTFSLFTYKSVARSVGVIEKHRLHSALPISLG
ncbi:MAG: hypothetical protein AN484_22995 [Aphanizomenon flos-aquae WA102]|uniref:Uncharacterized protein n=1 Tax=Aphanizomenon flos-aquae WA102 TaxID=1710896 RepID=A0A1B7WRS5_APHFL|nr:MAG: hypothetical protein AN484_22995 [Aphanizomenon flos-aquae WA102]